MIYKQDIIRQKAQHMEYADAVQHLNQVVSLYASRIAAEGQFSREAVERAAEIQAAWKRIQRG
jgi:hypothetical protein